MPVPYDPDTSAFREQVDQDILRWYDTLQRNKLDLEKRQIQVSQQTLESSPIAFGRDVMLQGGEGGGSGTAPVEIVLAEITSSFPFEGEFSREFDFGVPNPGSPPAGTTHARITRMVVSVTGPDGSVGGSNIYVDGPGSGGSSLHVTFGVEGYGSGVLAGMTKEFTADSGQFTATDVTFVFGTSELGPCDSVAVTLYGVWQ
jgi:hypothetical protein